MKDYNSISDNDRYFDISRIDTSIGVGILDLSRDIGNHFVRKKTFDVTFWMINQSLHQGLCTYSGFNYSVKELLNQSIVNGNKICIILAQGMMAPKLYRILDKTVEYFKENPNFFVMGHIMAKKDRYPGLHRQMLIVNLDKWIELGSPEFNEQGFFWDRKKEYSNYKLSKETLSADYAPAYIESLPGTQIVDVVEDGANWIDIACRNNIRIDNFSFEIRDCKAFLYPYDNSDKLERAWKNLQDEELLDSIENYTQRAWLRKLAYQEYIEKDRVYAYNTERLSGEGVRSPGVVDAIFSAAAGFKTMKLLDNNGFHKNTVVTYYDWCDASLKFKKHLLETWDGLDFDRWLLKHDLEYNFSSTYRGNYLEFWEQEIKKEFGTKEAFKELWDRYRLLKHNFIVVDLVNEPEKLFAEISKHTGNKVLWTTNIWPTFMLHWNVDIDEIEQKYLEFEKLIPDDLVLYGQDYLATDLQDRIRNDNKRTHPRYSSTNKYIINLEN
jgi:hypothetical protein